MESFISAASVVLSTLSISLPVSSLPTDTSSGHLNVERGTSGRYLQPFTAVYGDSSSDEPSNNIMKEINGRSNGINKGFGVNYVRIVINRTDDLDDFTIAHFSFKRRVHLKPALTDAALWQAPDGTTIPPEGCRYISAEGGDVMM
ncbi:hypothetical protein MMC22_004919 [Lobaria immixta]|nr:hypothetical protein [Lobaria immixta]